MDIKEGDDKKKSATFWMWFLAVFNLTKSHLKDYWNDGYVQYLLIIHVQWVVDGSNQKSLNYVNPILPVQYLKYMNDIFVRGETLEVYSTCKKKKIKYTYHCNMLLYKLIIKN